MQLAINQMFNFTPPHVANGNIKGVEDIVATLKAVRDFVSRAAFLYSNDL